MKNQNIQNPTRTHKTTQILTDTSEFYVKEAYRAARTNLSFALSDVEGCKVIVITSAVAGDGKTTTAVNMAISIAQANNRVLLIDADMRKASVRRYLNLQKTSGLSSVLSGASKVVDETIIKTPYGFDCMTSGPTPSNPAELLMSGVMSDMLDLLKSHYDYIILDTPPVTLVSDALALSKLISGVVITVSEGSSTMNEISDTISTLEFSGAHILGFIYNKSEPHNDFNHRYRYRYYDRKHGRYYRYYNYYYSNYGSVNNRSGSDK